MYQMSKAADNASTQDSSHGLPYFTGFAASSHGTAISSDLSTLRDNQTQQFNDQSWVPTINPGTEIPETFHK
jgi:hypothetical protein